MTEKNIILALGISYLFAFVALAEDVTDFNNPAGNTYTLSEDLNATGGDVTNYGTFIVEGTGLTINSEANVANRNGEAQFTISENSDLTVLVKEGFWNESYEGEGSGVVNLLEGSTLNIGNTDATANFTNNNEAIINIANKALLNVSGGFSNNGSAQVYLSEGATLSVDGELTMNNTSAITLTTATINNAGGLYVSADSEAAATISLANSILNTKELVIGRWASERVGSSLTLANSTINSTNDSSSRGTINVSGNSSILFEK